MDSNSNNFEIALPGFRADRLPRTIADHTRRVYDRMAFLYPLSTYFNHSKAHKMAMELSGIENGMRVLEVATGSGEMFRRLVRRNPSGLTIGLDLSPNMAARTQRMIRRRHPEARVACQAVDARHMPFRDGTFDALMCCYLFELLGHDDIARTLREFHRVLCPGRRFTLVLIGQDSRAFNGMYHVAGSLVPAFWGRQVENFIPPMIEAAGFRIVADHRVRQGYYPSRVLAMER
ncbi:MAG TPA: methyltransferase type 11 [Solibacterales bacterium]|nr:methyltransferase type 11 [Bryobacterales bacterium]